MDQPVGKSLFTWKLFPSTRPNVQCRGGASFYSVPQCTYLYSVTCCIMCPMPYCFLCSVLYSEYWAVSVPCALFCVLCQTILLSCVVCLVPYCFLCPLPCCISRLLNHFRIQSLASRRIQHDLIFIRNVFHGRHDCCHILNSFALHIPTRSTRTQKLFYEPRARVNTVKRGLFNRVPCLVNSFLCSVPGADFFTDATGTFKSHVLKYISSF